VVLSLIPCDGRLVRRRLWGTGPLLAATRETAREGSRGAKQGREAGREAGKAYRDARHAGRQTGRKKARQALHALPELASEKKRGDNLVRRASN
jgi:hypothetical protein